MEKRVYQLSQEQINIISNDLNEAIVLLTGTKNNKGLVEELNDVKNGLSINIDTIEDLKKDFIKSYENMNEIVRFAEQENFKFDVYKKQKLQEFNDFKTRLEDDFLEENAKIVKIKTDLKKDIETLTNDIKIFKNDFNSTLATAKEVTIYFEKIKRYIIIFAFLMGACGGGFIGFFLKGAF